MFYKQQEKDIYMNFMKMMFRNNPTSISLSLWWNMGSLTGLTIVMQIISGFLLVFTYKSDSMISFSVIQHVMVDSYLMYFVRIIHMNFASFTFVCLYTHIAKGIFYSSWKNSSVWLTGVLILLMIMGEAFLGYVLPFGSMSYWGSTVIFNLLSVVPFIGVSLVEWFWSGFYVNTNTLGMIFSLHFILPFVSLVIIFAHLINLHKKGSTSTLGLNTMMDKSCFWHMYLIQDIINLSIIFGFVIVSLLFPYALGDVEMMNEMNMTSSPIHIQPEWYFLCSYAILRSIPNKLGGILAFLMSVVILFFLPWMKNSDIFKHNSSMVMWSCFISNFTILTWIGMNPVEEPFIFVGQICSAFYFVIIFLL